jgi:hypothetical protein
MVAGNFLCSITMTLFWFTDMRDMRDRHGHARTAKPTLQSENPRSSRNWLCLAITLLKILFCERELSSRVKT